MEFLVEGLRISQKNLDGHFRTVEIPRYPRFFSIGVPENDPLGLVSEYSQMIPHFKETFVEH